MLTADRKNLKNEEEGAMSLMQNENKIGRIADPCGIPCFISRG